MIIIESNECFYSDFEKHFLTKQNDFIESIEYINNEFNEILIKRKNKYSTSFTNVKGLSHNPIGPADIWYDYDDGSIISKHYYINNVRHRENGPAYQFFEDNILREEKYYKNDNLHRLDGPAYIKYDKNGTIIVENFYINSNQINPKQFKKAVKEWNNDFNNN